MFVRSSNAPLKTIKQTGKVAFKPGKLTLFCGVHPSLKLGARFKGG